MSMNTRLLLITFLCVFSIGQCIAQTWYTGKDNFRQAIFQDSILSDYNYQAEKDIVNVTETDIHPGEGFRPSLSLDIANRNNRENKKYPVYRQSQTGTITKAGYVVKPYDTRNIFSELEKTIEDRKIHPVEKSYTNYLLNEGVDKICKKVGEEASETIIAAKNDDKDELVGEISDLLFHTFVLMNDRGVKLEDIENKLKERHKVVGNKKEFHTRGEY